VMKTGVLGDVYHVRLAWHRNGNWRRKGDPPSKDFDASKWGYPTWDHLWNWRLYWRYSQGLFAELGSHQVNATNWFLGTAPERVQACGGVYRFKDGREVPGHVYAMFEYPGGVTGTFTSIESNAFDERYEAFFGTKGTLIIRNENDAMLFDEGAGARPTGVEVAPKGAGAALETSETKPAQAGGAAREVSASTEGARGPSPTMIEIQSFCSAVRTGSPLACGPEEGSHSAAWAAAGRQGARANPNQLRLTQATAPSIARLREDLVSAHRERYGADADADLYVGLQLTHSGRYARPSAAGRPAPLAAYRHPFLDRRFPEGVRTLGDDELDRLVDRFVDAAALAWDAGFAFVDVKQCHGYLGHELLSARDRPGRYGGSLENRTLFLRSVIAGIRAKVPRLAVVVRLSVFDFFPFA